MPEFDVDITGCVRRSYTIVADDANEAKRRAQVMFDAYMNSPHIYVDNITILCGKRNNQTMNSEEISNE